MNGWLEALFEASPYLAIIASYYLSRYLERRHRWRKDRHRWS